MNALHKVLQACLDVQLNTDIEYIDMIYSSQTGQLDVFIAWYKHDDEYSAINQYEFTRDLLENPEYNIELERVVRHIKSKTIEFYDKRISEQYSIDDKTELHSQLMKTLNKIKDVTIGKQPEHFYIKYSYPKEKAVLYLIYPYGHEEIATFNPLSELIMIETWCINEG